MGRKPSKPTGVTATRLTSTSARIAWTDTSSFETGFQVQRRLSGGSWFTVVSVVVANVSSYDDTTLTAGVGADYRVRAVTLSAESPYSNIAVVSGTVAGTPDEDPGDPTPPDPDPLPAIPSAPTNVRATAGDASATLSWTAPSGASDYLVRQATVSGGPYTLVKTTSSTSTTIAPLANSTAYYWVVAARNVSGTGSNSSEVTATPVGLPSSPSLPTTPTGLQATAGNAQVSLTVDAQSGVTFNWKRSTTSGSGYVTFATSTSTSLTDTGVSNGTTYYYVVSASNATGTSANSSQVSASPAALSPGTGTVDYGFTAGWATFGLAIPQGFASSAVQVGSLTTQTDVKTTWADGSVRFCVVTAKPVGTGTLAVANAAAPGGTFTPTIPTASVTVTVSGSPFTATMPGSFSDVWLNGPNVYEARSIQAFSGASGATAQLRAVFDCRVYSDGAYRISIEVRNNRNHADANTLTYDVSMSVAGTPVFTQSTVVHSYMARYRKVFLSSSFESTITPDFTPLYDAQAIRKYLGTIHNPTPDVTGDEWGILRIGDLVHPLSTPGDRAEIGLIPAFAAQYLTHKTAAQKTYLLTNGDNVAGAISLHLDNTDNTMFTLDGKPNFFLHTLDSDGSSGPAGGGTLTYASEVAASHSPCLAYIPYLITGDRWYLDEMKYWANHAMLSSPWMRGDEGVITNNQVRDIAWALRDIVNAAKWCPDTDVHKSYFLEKYENNRLDLNTKFASEPDTTLGGSQLGQPNTNPITMFMDSYVVWALDHCERQGVTAPSHLMRMLSYWNALITANPSFDRRYVVSYRLFVVTKNAETFASYAALMAYNLTTVPADGVSHPWSVYNLSTSTLPPMTGGNSYGKNMYVIIALAKLRSIANASTNLTWLLTQVTDLADSDKAQYGIANS